MKTRQTSKVRSGFFQVWFLSENDASDWCSRLAVPVGDCDWLVFLLLRRGAAELDWRPPSAAGHRP